MPTVIKKIHNRKSLETFAIAINNAAGQLQLVRDGLTDDIRSLIKSANRADARMMLRNLSEAIQEINDRVSRLKLYIKDLEKVRDKIAKSIPENIKN